MAYSGVVTDPFRLKAPDGRTYFDILGAPKGLIALYRAMVVAIDKCSANAARATDPAVRAYWQGSRFRLDKALSDFRNELRSIAVATAANADSAITSHIKSTQVRPDTSKNRHLHDNVKSRPVPTSPELGIVGIADIGVLDRTRQRGGGKLQQPYWAAQEFGTDAHVGRVVYGFFEPGGARPSQTQFRQHPEFVAQRGGGRLTIQRPIEERGFLRQGVEDAGIYRARQLKKAEAKLIAEMRLVGNSRPPIARTPPRSRP